MEGTSAVDLLETRLSYEELRLVDLPAESTVESAARLLVAGVDGACTYTAIPHNAAYCEIVLRKDNGERLTSTTYPRYLLFYTSTVST